MNEQQLVQLSGDQVAQIIGQQQLELYVVKMQLAEALAKIGRLEQQVAKKVKPAEGEALP